MPQTDLAKIHESLRQHLSCNLHSDELHCSKPNGAPFNGKTCLRVDTERLHLWTQAVVAGVATVHVPPDTDDFNSLKETHKLQAGRHKKKSESPSPVAVAPPPAVATVPQYIYMPAPMKYPQTPRRSAPSIDDVSPVRLFQPQEYNNEALHTYLKYLTDKYKDDDFLAAFGPSARLRSELISSNRICRAVT